MANPKLLFSADMDVVKTSGFTNISIPLLTYLADKHWDIKVLGLEYRREEHKFPFTVVSTPGFRQQQKAISYIHQTWKPDIFVNALDIPLQNSMLQFFTGARIDIPYVGIFPLESTPLSMTWSTFIAQMSASLCISKFGTAECNRMGLPTKHLEVGMFDTIWKPAPEGRKQELRDTMFYGENPFIILTVADNHERKNLPKAFESVALFKEWNPEANVKFLLVTREHLRVGYDIQDLTRRYKLQKNIRIFEKGISPEELLNLYHISDAFLLSSKAEGLGMPVLEAQACGIPVVATNIGAIPEHLEDDRGFLVDSEYTFVDVYGNADRAFFDAEMGADCLGEIYNRGAAVRVGNALDYISTRTWDKAQQTFENTLLEVMNGKAK